jgi:hypothetical protein
MSADVNITQNQPTTVKTILPSYLANLGYLAVKVIFIPDLWMKPKPKAETLFRPGVCILVTGVIGSPDRLPEKMLYLFYQAVRYLPF